MNSLMTEYGCLVGVLCCVCLLLPSQHRFSLRQLIFQPLLLSFQTRMGLAPLLSIDACEPHCCNNISPLSLPTNAMHRVNELPLKRLSVFALSRADRLGSTEKVSSGVGKEDKVQSVQLSVSQLGLFLFLHLHTDSTNHRYAHTSRRVGVQLFCFFFSFLGVVVRMFLLASTTQTG